MDIYYNTVSPLLFHYFSTVQLSTFIVFCPDGREYVCILVIEYNIQNREYV